MFDKTLLSTLLAFSGILLLIYAVSPLIPGFCLALILVYIMNPMTDFFQRYVKRRFPATVVSLLIVSVSFGILFSLLIGEVVREVSHLLEYPRIQDFLGSKAIDLSEILSIETLLEGPSAGTGIRLLIQIAFQIGMFFVHIFLGLLISFFVVWKNFRIRVRDEKLKQFLHVIDRGIRQLVRSYFLTSTITGVIAIPIYYGFGLPYPLFLAAMTAFLALLPVIGAYLLYGPLAVILYFEEGAVPSVIFFGLCAFFIGIFPDVVVRPLTARTKEIGAVPLLVGFLGGILIFGASGIVLGPLSVIGAIAFYKVYMREAEEENPTKR